MTESSSRLAETTWNRMMEKSDSNNLLESHVHDALIGWKVNDQQQDGLLTVLIKESYNKFNLKAVKEMKITSELANFHSIMQFNSRYCDYSRKKWTEVSCCYRRG